MGRMLTVSLFLLVPLVTFEGQPLRTADLAGIQADFQVWGAQAAPANYGLGVAVATGDLNGDGIDDLIVGDHDATANAQTSAGRVHVFFGQANRPRETIDLATAAADVTIEGPAKDARLGRAVGVGDLNGDGIDDLIAGAPYFNRTSYWNAGVVYVFYGRGSWTSVVQVQSADVTVLGGKGSGRLGFAVAAGDVNQDGADDLLAGAPFVNMPSPRSNVGEAYVVFMSKTFPANHIIDLATTPPQVTITGRQYNDRLGLVVATGDPNGDGIDDFLTGSPMAHPGGRTNAGELYAVWGRRTWTTPLWIDLGSSQTPAPDLIIKGQNLYDRLAWTIACGDLNGDSVDDILTGAHRADPKYPTRSEGGKAFVFFGRSVWPAEIDLTVASPDHAIYGRATNDQLGFGVAIGDVDNDGKADLLASAPRADAPRVNCGNVYVFRGPVAGQTTIDLNVRSADWEIQGPADESYLGNGAVRLTDEFRSALALGDFNGDRITDIVMGAPRYSAAGRAQAGSAFVLYGGFTYWLDPPRVGTTARVKIQAPAYPSTFRFGAAAFGGEVGIPIDTRVFPLNPDVMFFFSVSSPSVFVNYTGWIDAQGEAIASVVIPGETALVGMTLYTAFLLLDNSAPSSTAAVGNRIPMTFEP